MFNRPNDQRKPGFIEPGLRKSTAHITKPAPQSEPDSRGHSDSSIDRRIEKSPIIRQPNKSSSFEAPRQFRDGKESGIMEWTLNQSCPNAFQREEIQTAREMIHSQTQTDPQFGTFDTVTDAQQENDPIRTKHDKEIADLQTELQRAKEKEAESHQNFLEAQEQIFSLQSRRPDITEDAATSDYNSLCIAVEDWIDFRFKAVLDLDAKIFTHSSPVDLASGSRFIQCIKITPGAMTSRDILGTLEYYIRNAIMNFFSHEIFERELYDIISEHWGLIRTIQNSMEKLQPRRDQATIRAWRSETLMAMLATTEYKDARRDRIIKLASYLCGGLRVLFPRASKQQMEGLRKSIAEELVSPAMALSEKFHLSAKIFSLNCRGSSSVSDLGVTEAELNDYECRNLLENGKVVRAGSLRPGAQCRYILDICPGLFCSSVKATAAPAKQLKKAQILIAVLEPGKAYESLAGETAISLIWKCIQKSKR